MDQALSDIYDGKSSQINSGLFNNYYNSYLKGINQVFPEVKPGHAMWDKVEQFKLNTARLAAHKSFQQTSELQKLAAKATSQAEFKKSAQAIVNKYNRYQSAEYNTVVARSRTAKQFAKFVTEKEHFPNIEWLRTASANPRELHLSYVGIILPQNDPFWQENQPGNLWNCKCNWRTTDEGVTSAPDSITPPARGLEGNPWETGELVTDRHPYYKGTPDWVDRNAQLLLPEDLAYVKVETEYGDYLEHRLNKDEPEMIENRKIATLLLQNDYKDVKLLPVINPAEKELRDRYFGKEYNRYFPTTNPDSIIDGKLIEFKKGSKDRLSKRIHEASMQSDIVLIRSKDVLKQYYLEEFINGQWAMEDRKNITTIIVINAGVLHKYVRP